MAYLARVDYTGNGSTQTITLDNTDADLDADMIWLKARNHAYSHQLFDTVRGATKLLNNKNIN